MLNKDGLKHLSKKTISTSTFDPNNPFLMKDARYGVFGWA
jgi:hypothetical protein